MKLYLSSYKLVTRVEFDEFKDQTLVHFDGLSKQIEDLQQEEILSPI